MNTTSITPTRERLHLGLVAAERRSEIASMGARAAAARGTAHRWDSQEAAVAGKKGGTISRGGRGRLPVREDGAQ